jgi:hypothetical protein
MKNLLSVIVAAMFATVTASAFAASHAGAQMKDDKGGAKMEKTEKSDKMGKKEAKAKGKKKAKKSDKMDKMDKK